MTGTIAQLDTHRTWGGGHTQVLALIRGLRERGVPAVLFARGDGELAGRAQDAGLPVVGLPPAIASRWYPGGGYFLAQWCAERDVSLLHAHDARALTLAQRAARRTGLPVVLSRRVASSLRRNPVSRFKYASARLDAVIATSRTVAGLVAQAGYPPSRTFIVESGTDVGALAAKPADAVLRRWADGLPLAGSVGKLVEKKNWELLLRVAAEMRARGRDLRWVIAGDGPRRASLEALRDRLGLRDLVRIDDDARDPECVVKALDVMFHPARREGSSAILRVAMLCRIPIVCANAPALVDALDGFGAIVDPDDAELAAGAVERAILDDGERMRMVDGAERVAQRRGPAWSRTNCRGISFAGWPAWPPCRASSSPSAACGWPMRSC